jgi:hypothetical protein
MFHHMSRELNIFLLYILQMYKDSGFCYVSLKNVESHLPGIELLIDHLDFVEACFYTIKMGLF